jgi:amino acid permease
MGVIFAYCFHLVARICKLTGTASYREAWEVNMGVDNSFAWLVALFTTLMAGLGNLAYSIILADSTRSLLLTAGLNFSRTECLIAVTVLVLWPLCMVKQLHVLMPFSLLGMVGMVFTVGAMFWRYWDGSYAVGGQFVEDIPSEFKPSFGSIGASGALGLNVLLLVCMCFQSYFCHYNAPR